MPGPRAKEHFANLSLQKQAIESALGFALDWQELPDARACRIAARETALKRSPFQD
jgi:hypothetical protein